MEKKHKLHLAKPKNEAEVRQLITEYITYYNQERFQKN